MTKETLESESLDLRSHDLAEEKRRELLCLFPEVRTESGKIDFERLKLALGEAVDVGKERYGMTWPGKADCFKTIQSPSLGTLRPCREESVNFDSTENLIIEGDNLEVLNITTRHRDINVVAAAGTAGVYGGIDRRHSCSAVSAARAQWRRVA